MLFVLFFCLFQHSKVMKIKFRPTEKTALGKCLSRHVQGVWGSLLENFCEVNTAEPWPDNLRLGELCCGPSVSSLCCHYQLGSRAAAALLFFLQVASHAFTPRHHPSIYLQALFIYSSPGGCFSFCFSCFYWFKIHTRAGLRAVFGVRVISVFLSITKKMFHLSY